MAVSTVQRRLLTADEFLQMAEAGILGEDERIELLGGEMYHMAAIGVRHANAVRRLINLLAKQIGDGIIVDAQDPIRLDDESMPQPDIFLVRDRNYTALPTPADTFLVIEVGDSSHMTDRTTKFPRYAAARIPEAWLVDLVAGTIERHTDPRDGAYQRIVAARAGETLTSTVLPEVTIPVSPVLGPPEAMQETP